MYTGGEKAKVSGDTFSFMTQKSGSTPGNPQYNAAVDYKKQGDGNFYVRTTEVKVAIFDKTGKFVDEVYDDTLNKQQKSYLQSSDAYAASQAVARAGGAVIKK